MIDHHEVGTAVCTHCGSTFEDLKVAILENGGWCPACDRPAISSPPCASHTPGDAS